MTKEDIDRLETERAALRAEERAIGDKWQEVSK